MSQSTAKGKLIGRFTIGFDDETKASISDLKTKLDAVPHRLEFGNIMPIGGLLAAMQGHAVNDSNGVVHHGENVKPELKQLGQWVFEGQDEKYVSAAVDANGDAHLYPVVKESLWFSSSILVFCVGRPDYLKLKGKFVADDWQQSAINRVPINDVEYLSNKGLEESVPHIDDVLALPNWLSDSTPQITQADLQLIFIQNLATTLIQRMHSMDRFSEDDYTIGGCGGDKLMAWDIVFNKVTQKFGVITGINDYALTSISLKKLGDKTSKFGNDWFHADSLIGNATTTITESQINDFKAVLEACYA